MSKATVELDFFSTEKETSSAPAAAKSLFQKFLHRRRSFRGVQDGISKIDPELIKSVIASSSANPVAAKGDFSPDLPVYNPNLSRHDPESSSETALLTIFYNGVVSVFDVTQDQAENILRRAVGGSVAKNVQPANSEVAVSSASSGHKDMVESLSGDLPITRRKSLQRFLEKRKQRLTSVSPLGCRM